MGQHKTDLFNLQKFLHLIKKPCIPLTSTNLEMLPRITHCSCLFLKYHMNLFNLHVSLVNFSMCAFIHFPSSIFVLFHFSILQDLSCKATYSTATFSSFHGNSSYLYLYHNVIVHCDMSFSNSQKKTFSLFFYLPLCLEGIQKLLLNFGIMEFFL